MQVVRTVALVAAMGAGVAAEAAPVDLYSSFVAFGDSLSDPGNLFAFAGQPGAPYFDGRFSNGPVWAEAITAEFQAAGAFSANFAFGGAKAVTDADPVPDLGAQLFLFSTNVPAAVLGGKPLASLWFGANDIFAALDSAGMVDAKAAAEAAADAVAGGAMALMGAGFRDFVLFNLPDIGATPAYALFNPLQAAEATLASLAFNARLDAQADALRLMGLNVTEIDTYGLFQSLLADPPSFGVANATIPCVIPGYSVCTPDEAKLLAFFDPVHPNATIHAALADVVREELAPVPLPASILLFGAALGALPLVRRRRAA